MKQIHVKTIVLIAVVVLLLTLAAQPPVAASPARAEPALSWYAVRGLVFTPNTSTMTWLNNGFNYCLAPSSAGGWRASLNLPDGSIIKTLVLGYYNQTSSDNASSAQIYRYNDSGGAGSFLGVNSSPGSVQIGFQSVSATTTSDQYVVDNSVYSYALNWGGSTTQDMCYMKVGYIPPSIFGVALPFVQKGP